MLIHASHMFVLLILLSYRAKNLSKEVPRVVIYAKLLKRGKSKRDEILSRQISGYIQESSADASFVEMLIKKWQKKPRN